ncbi:MAG TPA: acetyl-CoA carboxylase carboxyltransferase subunit alpha [Candidatus Marinimicrobia bacterium]|nr:acetyl-CoA carboxylase carboxyltransferase subunit alpha [Candidatus Neomarinimicrobiota bacterium]
MADYYLEFEKPLKLIDEKIIEMETSDDPDAHRLEIEELKQKRKDELEKIYSGLSRWQRVQLARHPRRPFSLDYIQNLAPDFVELHGDRHFADDPSLVGGLGSIDGQSILFIGQQKGRNTNENLFRNFGMMRPEGYRKALRLMKLAEKFNVPIVSLIDTPGAYPGIGAEERGQGEAIAKNLLEMSRLKVPILVIIIGEGASGGALGIGVCDRMLMLENTWYSVISPEGCASILWRDAALASNAADAMKVTPKDLLEMGICDRIIAEPLGGAHRKPDKMVESLKSVILEELNALLQTDPDAFLDQRISRYDAMGVFTESA